MRNTQLTADEIFEKAGLKARWEAMAEARGEEREATAIVKNMIGLEIPFETVVLATKLDPEKVRALYNES